jgi:stage V sporulation protein SpoVS
MFPRKSVGTHGVSDAVVRLHRSQLAADLNRVGVLVGLLARKVKAIVISLFFVYGACQDWAVVPSSSRVVINTSRYYVLLDHSEDTPEK